MTRLQYSRVEVGYSIVTSLDSSWTPGGGGGGYVQGGRLLAVCMCRAGKPGFSTKERWTMYKGWWAGPPGHPCSLVGLLTGLDTSTLGFLFMLL